MRQEKNRELQEQLQQTKNQLAKQIHRERGARHPLLNCLLITLLVAILLFALLAYGVSLTGLVRVPFFSSFYEPPTPAYPVAPAQEPLDSYITEQLTQEINERVQEAGSAEIDRSVDLLLQNGYFTAGLRQYIGEHSSLINAAEAQVAALPDQAALEVFLPLAKTRQKTALVMRLLPSLGQDGLLVVRLDRLQIGRLVLPNWLSRAIFKRPIDFAVNELNKAVGRYAVLQNLEVVPEGVLLNGQITADIIQLSI